MTEKDSPHVFCPHEIADVSAFQALERGDASPDQQKRALAWLINVAAMTYQPTFMADPYKSAYAEGRRFVGLKVVKLLKLSLTALHKASEARKVQPK